MGEFGIYLANHWIILFIFAIVELIFIIILLLKIIDLRDKLASEKKQTKYLEGENKRLSSDLITCRNDKNKLNGELNQFRNENGKRNNNQETPDNNQANKGGLSSQLNIEKKQSGLFDDGFGDFAKNAQKKGGIYRPTTNPDGSECHNLYFNLNDISKSDSLDESSSDSFEEPVPVSSFTPKYEYLETANGGQFRKLLPSDEKSLFRTWVENGVRKFEFHGNVDNALANFNAVFDDVCEIEGKQNGATQITNVEPGILSSQLKVEKKAIIKLT